MKGLIPNVMINNLNKLPDGVVDIIKSYLSTGEAYDLELSLQSDLVQEQATNWGYEEEFDEEMSDDFYIYDGEEDDGFYEDEHYYGDY
ncbi:MAG: hypothetical protein CL728_04465 [Chloroflexi bacterium]|nr:hypothetical protein [Chloroflexota bacterium]|tara:strand:- start:118 stop:381 length:264 start_codon:yes stop_codon:yes gene_type:complete